MRLRLHRTSQNEERTLGVIRIGDALLYTVEKPWVENVPGESCVPTGFYVLEPHNGKRFRDTWALVGQTVSHLPEPGIRRFACVFHAGNTAADVSGCIAPGMSAEPDGVVDSLSAMAVLRMHLGGEGPHFLNITRTTEKEK